MRFASLGSGSGGNALVVESDGHRIMVDCGFSLREATRRLARIGLTPEDIDAIFVTHEHLDHIGGVGRFTLKHKTPVYMSHGTRTDLNGNCADWNLHLLDTHNTLQFNGFAITPFTVPHDAREPVQYLICDGAHKLGVLTDLGMATPCVKEHVTGCDALVLESNHDATMLRNNPSYPLALKQRISGRFGHLENQEAANLLREIDCSRLQHIVAAHLSQHNNLPELARAALSQALNCAPDWITVASQTNGFDWRIL